MPHLIGIAVGALPHLNTVAIRQTVVGEIKAFASVNPSDLVSTRDRELLVLVIGGASINLHFNTIRLGPVRNIETLVSVDGESIP